MFKAALFVKAKDQTQPTFLPSKKWTICWYIHAMVYHTSVNECSEALWISLDEFQCLNLHFTQRRVFETNLSIFRKWSQESEMVRRKGTNKRCIIELLMAVDYCAHSTGNSEYGSELSLWGARLERLPLSPVPPQVDPLRYNYPEPLSCTQITQPSQTL